MPDYEHVPTWKIWCSEQSNWWAQRHDNHLDRSECVKSYKKSNEFVENFPESGKTNGHCKWPSYHADLSDLETHGEYQSVEIKNSFEIKTTIEARLVKKSGQI